MNNVQVNNYVNANHLPTTITDALGNFTEAFIVCETYDGDFISAHVWEEDEGVYINDSNLSFNSESECQSYYSRQFRAIWAFDCEDDRDAVMEFIEK